MSDAHVISGPGGTIILSPAVLAGAVGTAAAGFGGIRVRRGRRVLAPAVEVAIEELDA